MATLSRVLILLCLTASANTSPLTLTTTKLNLPAALSTFKYDDVIQVPRKILRGNSEDKLQDIPVRDVPHQFGTGHSESARRGQQNGKSRSGTLIHRLMTSKSRRRTTGRGNPERNFLFQRKEKAQLSHNETSRAKNKAPDYDTGDDVTDYNYDYDYTNDIYSLVHFREEILEYVDNQTALVNQSAHVELQALQMKIAELQQLLAEQPAQAQDQQVESTSNAQTQNTTVPGHVQGDVRLLDRLGGNADRDGFLQIYTGTEWGFVCDDFFNGVASRIACRQMGYSTGQTRILWSGFLGFAGEVSDIVLDDVKCSIDDSTLLSCRHAPWGQHDCGMMELVYLSCL